MALMIDDTKHIEALRFDFRKAFLLELIVTICCFVVVSNSHTNVRLCNGLWTNGKWLKKG